MDISRLDRIDQLIVVLFIIFASCIITGFLITSSESIKEWFIRKLASATARMEQLNEWLRDDERFDPTWMDYDSWRATSCTRKRGN